MKSHVQSLAATVLSVKGLRVGFTNRNQNELARDALQGVDFDVKAHETLAIVGESGCGKSLTAMAIAGLLPSKAVLRSGSITLCNLEVSTFTDKQWRSQRGVNVGVVFQDPMSSLNPVLTVGEQLIEAVEAHRSMSRPEARARSVALLHSVKLPDPAGILKLYPHQLSGGMRQRVMIAIAISNDPALLIADEPTTALDATVQEEILQLLHDLQQQTGMAIVLITHDVGLVSRWAHRTMVMYAGRIVEDGITLAMLANPTHPYTQALLQARPVRREANSPRPRLMEIPGRVPSLADKIVGCSFAPRCSRARERCAHETPSKTSTESGWVACHAAGDESPPVSLRFSESS
jgi:peptide/nickel transport system ATP-binding protein